MKLDFSALEKTPYWQFYSEINQLCQPIFDQFGINYFDYSRFYPDKTCVSLSSDPNYVQFLLSEENYRCPAGLIPDGKHLWASYIDPAFIHHTNGYYDYHHGFTYQKKNDHYLELINFSAPKNNFHVLNVYVNYSEMLDYFLTYFVKAIEPFLKRHSHTRIVLPENFLPSNSIIHPPNMTAFINQLNEKNNIRKNTFLINFNAQTVPLTLREVECLSYFSRGWCTKKIARKMDVSTRTVEAFFNKILLKTNCATRIELSSKLEPNLTKLLETIAFF